MDLEIHKNAWPDYILDMLDDKIQSFLSGNLEVATNRWPEDVAQWSPHTLLYHFQPETEEHSELKNIVLKKWNVDTKTTCSECLAPKEFIHFEFLLHFMPTGSYMPWHNDKHHKFVATTYLNKEWDWNWGGAFLCVDKNGENKFLTQCKQVGVSGLIVVDLPWPDNKMFARKCKKTLAFSVELV